jgi:hypothetical protein
VLVRATVDARSEGSLDWALGRARRLLTSRRGGVVDVLCRVADEDAFWDLRDVFLSGVNGEAARANRAPLARLVRVDAAAVPEDVARRAGGRQFFSRAVRGDDRARLARCCDDATPTYWVAPAAPDAIRALLPRGATFVVDGVRDLSEWAETPGCCGVVLDWAALDAG